MRIILTLLVWTTASAYSFGGQVEEVIKKMQRIYTESKQLEYNTTYELFKGHKSTEVHSSYNGYICRNENLVYQKIKNTEFVYGSDFFLQISHDEQAVALDLAQRNIQREIDFETIMEHCAEKTISEKEGFYLITLTYRNGSPSVFSNVKLKISKANYHLHQLDLYYKNSLNFSQSYSHSEMAQPHLRIKFKGMKLNVEPDKELFRFSKYVETKNSMLSPTGNCKGYELIDNRI